MLRSIKDATTIQGAGHVGQALAYGPAGGGSSKEREIPAMPANWPSMPPPETTPDLALAVVLGADRTSSSITDRSSRTAGASRTTTGAAR